MVAGPCLSLGEGIVTVSLKKRAIYNLSPLVILTIPTLAIFLHALVQHSNQVQLYLSLSKLSIPILKYQPI